MKIQKSNPHQSAKAGVGMMVVLLAFGLFLLFYNYQDYLMESGQFTFFMVLTTVGLALMLGLVYLVFNQKEPHKAKTVKAPAKSTKSSAKAKKKKK